MSSPGSLRELYAPPPTSWTFESVADRVSVPAGSDPSPSVSHQWPTRPSTNSVLDLSPSLAESGANATELVRAVLASALMQYTTTAMIMPFEVGKTLLQVQWVPRDAEDLPEADPEVEEEKLEETSDMDSNEEDSYFADPSSSSRTRKYLKPQPVDEQGYVVRKSVMEDGTRPEYIIPVGSASGVWNMIKHVGRFRMEGWTSLWKGLLTYTLHEGIFINIEPIIRSSLRSLVMPHLIPYSYSSSILFPLASQIATGIFLSPLHLVRTRLIVQSGSSRHARYSGPIDALKQIARDEGGVRGMYFHPQILIPTVLERGTSALVALALPRALTMVLGFSHIAPDTHPLIWTAAECVASAVGLLMTLPLETVRHRLEVQVRGQAKPLRTCVETRPAPYNGVVDAIWHILTEERSDLPIKPRRRLRRRQSAGGDAAEEQKRREQEAAAESWWKHTGLGQLYRGVGLRATAGLVVLFAGMLNGGDEPELGWTEL